MATYSIKELEQLSQVKAHTIRIWEKRYGLLSPERSDTNIRSYTDDDLRKLLNVATLSQHGMKVSHIAELSAKEMEQEVLRLSTGSDQPANELEGLVMAMMELDEERFERVISNAVLRRGFEQTMYQLLIPFLNRVGVLWRAGMVRPGQEHFVSQLIRQKLLAAIDGLVPDVRKQRRNLILFLCEGELHELGLLFALFIAKRSGHRVFYLGQSVPMSDLKAVAERHRPDLLVTAFLTTRDSAHVREQLAELARINPKALVLAHVSVDMEGRKLPGNVRLMSDLSDLSKELA